MNSPKMRPILLAAFLLVTSLVIAKAGLQWTSDNDSSEEANYEATEDHARMEQEQLMREKEDRHAEHMEHLARLKENEARLREHAEKLAEQIASSVDIKVKVHTDPNVKVTIEGLEGLEGLEELEKLEGSSYSYSYNYDYDYDYDYDFDFDGDDLGDLVMHEKFNTSPGSNLVVKVPGADLQVVSGESDVAEIFIFLDADNESKAHKYFADLNFEIRSSGDDIYVTAESNSDWGWSGHGNAQLTVRAQIPPRFNAKLSTSGGDVSVQQLQGTLALATSGGDIEMGAISGDGIKVTTSGGDIEAGALNGPMKLTTSGGDIELGAVNGPEVYVTTSGGDIEMGAVSGGKVTVKTSGGDIEVGHVQGDQTMIKTSGGDIAIGNMDGDLEAATSGGDITVRLSKAWSVDLSTTGGSIDIIAPRSIGANLKLDAGEVTLIGSMEFRGTNDEDRVDGEINGGGPTIRARANHGEVNLHLQ